jgi:FkbM family methyltransferase
MSNLLQASVNLLPHAVRRHIHRIPGVAALQRWLIARFASNTPFIHVIHGGPASSLRFEVTLPLDKAIWAGTVELEFASVLRSAVKKGEICYDVGGYRGYMAGVMALAGAAEVIVFEPLSANIVALEKFRALNPQLPVTLHNLAVGDEDGTARFKTMTDHSMGKLSTSPFQPSATAVTEQEIRVRRLDSLIAEALIPPPDILKIDVEGAEYQVLLGADDLLRKYRPRIYMEAHSTALELSCCAKLRELGYTVTILETPPFENEQPRHLICIP